MPRTAEMSVRCLSTWPRQYYNSLKPKKFEDIFNSPVCSIAKFRIETGDLKAKALMVIMLSDLVEFFNVGNSMNASQIAGTVEIILENYGYMKIDDFKLCFDRIKRGMYGQIYRMDGNVIVSFIEKYLAERENRAEDIHYSNHLSIKAAERRNYSFNELIQKGLINKKMKK
jgi:hypothetical protein